MKKHGYQNHWIEQKERLIFSKKLMAAKATGCKIKKKKQRTKARGKRNQEVVSNYLLVAAKAAESNPRCVQISWEIRVEYLCFNEICPQIITMLRNPSCKGYHLRAFFCRFLELSLPSFRRFFSGNFPRSFWKTKS